MGKRLCHPFPGNQEVGRRCEDHCPKCNIFLRTHLPLSPQPCPKLLWVDAQRPKEVPRAGDHIHDMACSCDVVWGPEKIVARQLARGALTGPALQYPGGPG